MGKEQWLEVEDAIAHMGLFSEAAITPITHTMCDVCMNDLEEDED
ncbi:hypothetical protein [Candidatus Reidiella endopervernicosa]|nr:hypothetical protein [Candidatus Reidiella endopervernicosa]